MTFHEEEKRGLNGEGLGFADIRGACSLVRQVGLLLVSKNLLCLDKSDCLWPLMPKIRSSKG